MVCLDFHWINNTVYSFDVEEINGSAEEITGDREIGSEQTDGVLKMRPDTGFMWVECGIQGHLMLKCRELDVNITVIYDFPACGEDTISANPSNVDAFVCNVTDGGKYGDDNPHNLIIEISENPQLAEARKAYPDDEAIFFRDFGKDLALEGFSALCSL